MSREKNPEVSTAIYLTWGGTGRAASFRAALEQAVGTGLAELVYLAVLDDGSFGDLDEPMYELVASELEWLIETEIELAARQTDSDIEARCVVRRGDVADAVVEVADVSGAELVMVGAPLPDHERVVELADLVRSRSGLPVELVGVVTDN